jgi:hypothetical protein
VTNGALALEHLAQLAARVFRELSSAAVDDAHEGPQPLQR